MKSEDAIIERNIELSGEFSRYLFDHPELEAEIPPGAEIIFLTEYDVELRAYNQNLGKAIEADGGEVVYVDIKAIRPKIFSRIQGLELRV